MMDNRAVADWIAEVLARTGWHCTRLARESKLDPATVLRNADPANPRVANLRTLRKIAAAAGVEVPPELVRSREGVPRETHPRMEETASRPLPAREEPGSVPMRSFGPMPARLSPVKRGEIRVPRPEALAGIEGAYAFHPENDELAPAARSGDLLYAEPGIGMAEGDLVVLETPAGRARVGFLVRIEAEGYRLVVRGGEVLVPASEVAEASTVVLVDRKGRPRFARQDRAALAA